MIKCKSRSPHCILMGTYKRSNSPQPNVCTVNVYFEYSIGPTSSLFSNMCSSEILLIDLQGEHQQKEEGVIFDNALHLVQYLLRTGQSIPLTVGRMITGRVLCTLNGFLGLNNPSHWPHSGDNSLTSSFPFLPVFHSTVFLNQISLIQSMKEKGMTRIFIISRMECIGVYSFCTKCDCAQIF